MDDLSSWPQLDALPKPSAFRNEDALQAGGPYSGVYILLDLTGVPVYVGQSIDIAARINAHRFGSYGRPPKSFHRAVWAEVDDDSDRLRFEGILIIALAPRLNREVRLGRADDGHFYVPGRKVYGRQSRQSHTAKVDASPRKGVAKSNARRRARSPGAPPNDLGNQGR